MIPEKGKTYYIDYKDSGTPEFTHFTGEGVCTGINENDYTGTFYEFILPNIDTEGGNFFEEKYILREINLRDGTSLDGFLLEEANLKIKHLKALLFETLEYIRSEKTFRQIWVGPDARQDREADNLLKEIKSQFTEDEMEEANKTCHEKYK